MNFDWLKPGIAPLQELIGFLHKEAKTADVTKKHLIRELRNNLNIFQNGFMNNISADVLIDMLSNDAYKDALKNDFKFKKLKNGIITAAHVTDDRNKKYIGWNAERLMDKIDEKTEELKNLKKMNGGSVITVKNNVSLMLSNIYFRMILLANFIKDAK